MDATKRQYTSGANKKQKLEEEKEGEPSKNMVGGQPVHYRKRVILLLQLHINSVNSMKEKQMTLASFKIKRVKMLVFYFLSLT